MDELVAGGHGERFDANKGTPMKEWFSLDPGSGAALAPLAREALDFAMAQVRGNPPITRHNPRESQAWSAVTPKYNSAVRIIR